MFGHLIQGLSTALLLGNLFYLVLGVTGGIVIGALPGLTATMGVAILLPFTFGMDAVTGLIMLVGIYIGAIYGGSISAILLNTPGTIDSDYRGELKVIMVNLSKDEYVINPQERIGQLVLNKVAQMEFVEVDSLDETERGAGGFGHTGK